MVNVDSSTSEAATGRRWVAAFDGARLAARRQAKGWSRARLAKALHERAKMVRDLATALEVDVLDLMTAGTPLTLAALRERSAVATGP